MRETPRRARCRRTRAPTPTAIAATVRTTRSSSCASGLRGRRPAWVRDAIAASRVLVPVASTTARPAPSTTNVPANSRPSSSTVTGTLSPVSIEVSRRSPWASTTRRSADTRSPASSSTRSSTTRSAASTSTERPSRTTIARRGSRSRRRSAACSARLSCTNANTPLTTTTTKIATPSSGRPATKASTPATHSISAKKWVICATSCLHAAGGLAVGRMLRPSRARRAAASASLRPGARSVIRLRRRRVARRALRARCARGSESPGPRRPASPGQCAPPGEW